MQVCTSNALPEYSGRAFDVHTPYYLTAMLNVTAFFNGFQFPPAAPFFILSNRIRFLSDKKAYSFFGTIVVNTNSTLTKCYLHAMPGGSPPGPFYINVKAISF